MVISYFCNKKRHLDCPLEIPIDDFCESDHDCSFDIKLKKCECSCHMIKQVH